jgi:hypothetical protein
MSQNMQANSAIKYSRPSGKLWKRIVKFFRKILGYNFHVFQKNSGYHFNLLQENFETSFHVLQAKPGTQPSGPSGLFWVVTCRIL